MLGRTYEREDCSAARALEITGERWSLLILRNAAFAGMTRFSQFQEGLGIAPNVLTARLEWFVEQGLMTADTTAGAYPEYRLTQKGLDFVPALIALTDWGNRWAAPDGAPISYDHADCGGHVSLHLSCESCGKTVASENVTARKTEAMTRAKQRRAEAAVKA